MKAPNEISVISINNKEDVLKTIELFNKIGINVFKDKLSKNLFILSEEEITKCFLISDNDGNWRLQSHFLTDGISVKQLEEIINTVLSINEQIKNDIGKNKRIYKI